ncbi:hypothetical protein ACU8KI_16120 [Rhizobium leguminosarum]
MATQAVMAARVGMVDKADWEARGSPQVNQCSIAVEDRGEVETAEVVVLAETVATADVGETAAQSL